MSAQRTIARKQERQGFALDLLETLGELPTCRSATMALAGNTGSGLRRFAAREASRRVKIYFERTGIRTVVTPRKVRELALQTARQAREAVAARDVKRMEHAKQAAEALVEEAKTNPELAATIEEMRREEGQ